MRINRLLKQFNWRFVLVRILVNALALAVTAAIVPKIYFVDKSVWNWLLMAIMLGILNALLKPILQFLTLQFLFVTYGLVVVVVNTLHAVATGAPVPGAVCGRQSVVGSGRWPGIGVAQLLPRKPAGSVNADCARRTSRTARSD